MVDGLRFLWSVNLQTEPTRSTLDRKPTSKGTLQ